MHLFKKSLLISSCFFWGVYGAWAMEELHEDTTNSTTIVMHSPLASQALVEEQRQQHDLRRRQLILEDTSVLYSSGEDFSHQHIIQGFGRLPLLALPHLSTEWIYVKDREGKPVPKRISNFLNETFKIIVFGPGPMGLINYRTDQTPFGAYQTESFSSPQICFSSAERTKMRGQMGVQYPIVKGRKELTKKNTPLAGLDRCHWNELHYIIPQLHDSNKDPKGLFPGCAEFNQHIQGPFASSVEGCSRGGIGLIGFYDEAPLTTQQRIRLGYRKLTEWQPVSVPAGFILKQISSDERGEIFYFPHDIGPASQNLWPTHVCLYKRLIRERGGCYAAAEQFKIQNAAHLFRPLILDLELPHLQTQANVYRTFFLGLNLLPEMKSLEGLSLLSALGVPVAVNFTTGYTPEQVSQIAHFIHSDKPIPSELAPRYPYWNNFQLPVSVNGRMEWTVDVNLIPLFSRSMEASDRTRFLKYIGLRKIEEAAKAQLDSVKLKLAVIEFYYSERNYKKAKEWFLLACSQCEHLNSLPEALLLFKRYFLYRENITDLPQKQRELDYLIALINKTLPGAKLEDLLELEVFNEEMRGRIPYIPTGLEQVKEVNSQNSKILQKRFISSKNVKTLVHLLGVTKSLQKLDLKDTCFVVHDEECYRTFPIGDDDWDIEGISEEEYFWDEEKPLSQILTALEKNHGDSLKILNLADITFNGYSEGAEVLKTFRSRKFMGLEDLYLTGNLIDGADTDALDALKNLQTYFPRLQNIFYGWDIDFKLKLEHLLSLRDVVSAPQTRNQRQIYRITR